MAFKMYGKSPMTKKLIGKQANLPAELKAKIEAAPESPAKFLGGALKGLKKLGLDGGAMSVVKRAGGKKATASGSKKTKPTSKMGMIGAGMIGKAAGKGQSRPVRKPAKIAAPTKPGNMLGIGGAGASKVKAKAKANKALTALEKAKMTKAGSAVKMKKAPAKMAKDPAMKMAKDPAMKMKKAPTKMKKAPMRKDKVTYSEAYNKLKPTKSGGRYDEKNKKNYNSEAEFTAAAKAYNAKKNTPKKIETKKVTKVEVKTAKPELKKALTEKEVRKAKRKAIAAKIFGDGSKRKAYEANKKKRENRSPTGRMKNKASKFRRPGDNM